MASNRNNSGSNVEQGVIARISGAIKYVLNGSKGDWFSPLDPLLPVAPESAAGRQFDYQTGYNVNTRPRTNEAVSFWQMRALADNLDILRLVIETRKDQIAALDWTIKVKGGKDGDEDSRCAALTTLFSMPDGDHTWSEWLRMLLEDLFVLDAPAIYPRLTVGGDAYAFEPIDGATIKRVIDIGGRTPAAPKPAYQQVLKGLPATDYTRDELIYKPRNPRTNKVYGYSPVEQIIMTVNIAIRRQLSQLSYYTDGSTPDLIFSTPTEWNPDQIKMFRSYWQEMLAGNIAGKRGTMFVPAGVAPVNTKEAVLKDTYDEWLARIVCYAFSVPPTPFVKETNRATAQTSESVARQEGLVPLMKWVTDLINQIIVKYFKYTDIEFKWQLTDEVSPLIKAQVSQIYVNAGVLTADEVRDADLSLPPLTAAQKEELAPPPPQPPPPDVMEPGHDPAAPTTGTQSKKVQAASLNKQAIKPINRNRQAVTKPREALAKAIKAAFAKVKIAAVSKLEKSASGTITKSGDTDDDNIDLSDLDELQAAFDKAFSSVAVDGVSVAFIQIDHDNPDITNQSNDKAIEWSQTRSAELVGKKVLDDGSIIDNPNEAWTITDSTRDRIQSLVTQALDEGWSSDELSDAIDDDGALGDDRADLIATTELAMADVAGNMIAYRDSGVVEKKSWLVGEDSCDECQGNADEGDIGIDDIFKDGSDCAPAHPRCTCDVMPVVSDLPDDQNNEDN